MTVQVLEYGTVYLNAGDQIWRMSSSSNQVQISCHRLGPGSFQIGVKHLSANPAVNLKPLLLIVSGQGTALVDQGYRAHAFVRQKTETMDSARNVTSVTFSVVTERPYTTMEVGGAPVPYEPADADFTFVLIGVDAWFDGPLT